MENSPLALFEHEKFGSLRVVERKVQPWFVAKDVCDILEMGNPRSSLALLDEDEKGVHSMDTPGGKHKRKPPFLDRFGGSAKRTCWRPAIENHQHKKDK